MGIIHGLDANQNQRPMLVDSTGRPLVYAVISGTPTVNINTIPAVTLNQPIKVMGQDSSDVKVSSGGGNQFFGVYEPVRFSYVNGSLPTGQTIVDLVTVPGSFFYVFTYFNAYYVGTVTAVDITLSVVYLGNTYDFFSIDPPVSAVRYAQPINIVCGSGDIIRLTINGATLNNDIFCYLHGYSMAATYS
jgi:hypothetical protein